MAVSRTSYDPTPPVNPSAMIPGHYPALWDFMQDFQAHGLAAWEAFVASRQARPYVHPQRLASGETATTQQALEARYYAPAMLEKYQRAPGHTARD